MIGSLRRPRKFLRNCLEALQCPVRCFLAACIVGGFADSAGAIPVAVEAASPNYVTVLRIGSSTGKSGAGCPGSVCGAAKSTQRGSPGTTQLAQAQAGALRAAAATLQSGSSFSGIAGTSSILRTARDSLRNLSVTSKLGAGDIVSLGSENKGDSSRRNVSSGGTTQSANADFTSTAAFSDVLYNVANNAGVAWDGGVNSAATFAKRKVPSGELSPY